MFMFVCSPHDAFLHFKNKSPSLFVHFRFSLKLSLIVRKLTPYRKREASFRCKSIHINSIQLLYYAFRILKVAVNVNNHKNREGSIKENFRPRGELLIIKTK